MKKIIISGSARRDGNTSKVVDLLALDMGCGHIDLNDYVIGYYDYKHSNKDDDFLPLMRKLVSTYDTFVFVTPVYWYAMSAPMKTFFDRFTDLITTEKEVGRQLRGKSMAVVTSSNGGNLGDNFWLPFVETANYLGISYLGNLHTKSDQDNERIIKQFVDYHQLK